MSGETVVLVVNVVFAVGTVLILGYYGWRSYQRRRIEPMLMLSLALTCLMLTESPADWAFFCQFNPAFGHLPDWFPLNITHGGLPWMAIPAYAFVWAIPIVAARGLAKRISVASWTYGQRLMLCGFVVGFAWEGTMEILATRLGAWRFAYVPWGLSLFSGTIYQMTFTVTIMSSIFLMACTFIIGLRDANDDDVLLKWARIRTSTPRSRGWLYFAALVVYVHVFYLAPLVPVFAVNVFGLTGTRAPGPLFDDIPIQDSPNGTSPIAGFLVLVIGMGAVLICSVWAGKRAEKWLVGQEDTLLSGPTKAHA